MKIIVLNGSPRANGSTAAFANAFKEGAEGAGHEVTISPIGSMKINGCLGCQYCHTKGEGKCIQRDDMDKVYEPLNEADMVVLASPIYYWSFTGQMQSVITRFYNTGRPQKASKYAMILSSGADGVYDAPVSQYNSIINYLNRFSPSENVGILTFSGENQKNEENLAKVRAFAAAL